MATAICRSDSIKVGRNLNEADKSGSYKLACCRMTIAVSHNLDPNHLWFLLFMTIYLMTIRLSGIYFGALTHSVFG